MISSTEKQQLRQLLHAAGDCLLQYWPGSQKESELGVEVKADGSLVSKADLASNALITEGLQKLFPADGIHSEEATIQLDQWVQPRVWIIDPLDGTDVFLRGKDEFSIHLALTIEGKPILGFVFFPARGLLLEAETGKGAYCEGQTEPITLSNNELPRLRGVYARGCTLNNPDVVYPERLDSGHAFLMLIQGDLDAIVFRLDKLREWDLAAASIILTEAGGKVTDENGAQLSFRCGELPLLYIASNSACHEYTREACSFVSS